MKAREIMTTPVVSIGPLAKVHEVARLLVDSGISAVPVVDIQKRVIGMVSEGDLVRRKEIRTQKRRSWWLELLTSGDTLARDYTQSHTAAVRDVMSTSVISVSCGALAPASVGLRGLLQLLPHPTGLCAKIVRSTGPSRGRARSDPCRSSADFITSMRGFNFRYTHVLDGRALSFSCVRRERVDNAAV